MTKQLEDATEQTLPADIAAELLALLTIKVLKPPGQMLEVQQIAVPEIKQIKYAAVMSTGFASGSKAERLRFAALPGRVRTLRVRQQMFSAVIKRSLAPVIAQPIRRRLVEPEAMSAEEREAVRRALVGKYGSAAAHLTFLGVFRGVPADCVGTVRMEQQGDFCDFVLPSHGKANQLTDGRGLAVARGDSGQTYLLSVRLEAS